MFRHLLKASRLALPAALAFSAVTATSAHADDNNLGDVRAATVRFHSVTQAHKAGYADPGLPCFDEPAQGKGMGTHLVNGTLLNDGGALSRTHPEALVYEIRKGSLKLVAVEYIVKMSDSASRPSFLGRPMDENDALGLWTLHAWIYRTNPDGVFEAFNSNVALCPTNSQLQQRAGSAHAVAVHGEVTPGQSVQVSAPTQGRPGALEAQVSDSRLLQLMGNEHASAVRAQLADIGGLRFAGTAHAGAVRQQLADLR